MVCKKAQSALEYLMSYGWAILILVIIGGVLFALGVFNPDQSTATVVYELSNFHVDDALLESDGSLSIDLGVKTGVTTQIQNIDYSVQGYSCTNSVDETDFNISPEGTILIELSSDNSCDLEQGSVVYMNVSINYVKRSGLTHTDRGRIRIQVQSNQSSSNESAFGSYVWFTGNESSFNEGTYLNTEYGSVTLSTGETTGSYTSKVFNAGITATWSNISWNQEWEDKEEYSSNSNTVLLMHLNEEIGQLPYGFNNSVLLYHFDESSGNIIDYSGYGNTGSVSEVSYSETGVFNNALGFDGADDYIAANNDNSINPTNSITVAAWIKPESTSDFGNKVIVSKNGFIYSGWDLYHEYYHNGSFFAPRLRVRIDGNTTNSNIEVTENIWQHIGFTYNSTHLNLFKNGELLYTQFNDSFSLNSSNNLRIGGFSGGGNHFKGLIDELIIFNYSLTPAEFNELYLRNNSLITDFSSQNNDGTSYGPFSSNGFFKKSLVFDGTNDYVKINDDSSIDLTTSGTIGAWVNIKEHQDYAGIVHKGDSDDFSDEAYGLQFWEDNGRVRMFISNTSYVYNQVDSNSLLNTNQWYFLTGTWNESSINIYINGLLDNSNSNSLSARNTNGDLLIGCQVETDYCPNGTIDEVFVLNEDLKQSEILNLYKQGILSLQSSFRSCDDNLCSGESWSSEYDSPLTLSVADNQFFQYKFNFYTEDSSYTPILYNVTVNYEIS